MAEAAKEQVDWIRRQFWATVAEVGALVVTVFFTAWAAVAATRAVKAAQESVKVASTTAERQLRAYVYILDGSFYLRAGEIEGTIALKNFGQTPATNFEVFARCGIFDADAPDFNMTKLQPDKSAKSILGPTAVTEAMRATKIAVTDPQAIVDGKKIVCIWGKVTYTDAFKNPRYFIFREMNHARMPIKGAWAIETHPLGEEEG